MAKFNVTFANHIDGDGNTFEFPADVLDTNATEIEYFDFVKSDIKKGDGFARETWQYEVADKDASRFALGLDRTPTVLSYKQVRK